MNKDDESMGYDFSQEEIHIYVYVELLLIDYYVLYISWLRRTNERIHLCRWLDRIHSFFSSSVLYLSLFTTNSFITTKKNDVGVLQSKHRWMLVHDLFQEEYLSTTCVVGHSFVETASSYGASGQG